MTEQMLTRVKERLTRHNTEHPDLPVHLALGTATAEKNNLTKEFTFADQRMYADKAMRKANSVLPKNGTQDAENRLSKTPFSTEARAIR